MRRHRFKTHPLYCRRSSRIGGPILGIFKVLGGIISAIGAGRSAAAQANAAARAHDLNAAIFEQRAQTALQVGAENARRTRTLGKKKVGELKARFGGAGVQLDIGSPFDAVQEEAAARELDALTAFFEGESEAHQLRQSATLERLAASSARSRARAAKSSAGLSAITGAITGIGGLLGGGGGGFSSPGISVSGSLSGSTGFGIKAGL